MERVEEVILTKELVDHLLSTNTENRDLKKTRCQLYADDIKNHGWRKMGLIMVNEKGNLADGQHRLTALRMADVYNVPALILWDATKETIDRADGGTSRSAKDFSTSNGLKLTSSQVGAVRLDVNMNKTLHKKSSAVPNYIFREHYFNKWEKIFSEMPLLASNIKNAPGKMKIFAACICAIGNYGFYTSYEKANEFLEDLVNGTGKINPATRLREYIMVSRGSTKGGNSETELFKKAVYCINAHYRGEEINRIREAKAWEIPIK